MKCDHLVCKKQRRVVADVLWADDEHKTEVRDVQQRKDRWVQEFSRLFTEQKADVSFDEEFAKRIRDELSLRLLEEDRMCREEHADQVVGINARVALPEVVRATQRLRRRRSGGVDRVPSELILDGGGWIT